MTFNHQPRRSHTLFATQSTRMDCRCAGIPQNEPMASRRVSHLQSSLLPRPRTNHPRRSSLLLECSISCTQISVTNKSRKPPRQRSLSVRRRGSIIALPPVARFVAGWLSCSRASSAPSAAGGSSLRATTVARLSALRATSVRPLLLNYTNN